MTQQTAAQGLFEGPVDTQSRTDNGVPQLRGNHVSGFTVNMIKGCQAALDAGVFYQDEFCDFVVKHMGGYGCEAVLAETVTEPDRGAPDYFELRRATMDGLANRIAASPRGHYALVKYTGSDGTDRYSLKVSDGSGKLAVGGACDGYDAPPSGEKILERMVGYEIYECRNAVEAKRRVEANIAALKRQGFKVGMEFKNYMHPGEPRPYSKVVIQELYPDFGQVKIHLTKRGSPKRWEASIGALTLAVRVGLQQEPASNAPPFIVVVKHGDPIGTEGRQ